MCKKCTNFFIKNSFVAIKTAVLLSSVETWSRNFAKFRVLYWELRFFENNHHALISPNFVSSI